MIPKVFSTSNIGFVRNLGNTVAEVIKKNKC